MKYRGHMAGLGLFFSFCILLLTGCGSTAEVSGSALSCHHGQGGTPSPYQDFYQLVAAGIDSCSDMIYFSEQCASAPGGVWGSSGAGVLGNPVASCNAAMAARNQVLRCNLGG